MVKTKALQNGTFTTHDADVPINNEIDMIGDVLGFDVSILSTATFASGASNPRDLMKQFKLVVDGSRTLHDLENFNDDALLAVLSMLAQIDNPTAEDHVTTDEKKLHFYLPFSMIRALYQKVELKFTKTAGTTINAAITALSDVVNIAVRYGHVQEMIRFTSQLNDTAKAEYAEPMPTDRGNLTGFFLISSDADLVHPGTTISITDENGLPMIDEVSAENIIVQNETLMGDGWTGAYEAIYILYVDCPLIPGKPDLKLKVSCNGALTNGLQIYFMNSYATQQITPEGLTRVSPKELEIGAYPPSTVKIDIYESLQEQMNRVTFPIVRAEQAGETVQQVEKTVQTGG